MQAIKADSNMQDQLQRKLQACFGKLKRSPLDGAARQEAVRLLVRLDRYSEAIRQIEILDRLSLADENIGQLRERCLREIERDRMSRAKLLERLNEDVRLNPHDAAAHVRLVSVIRKENLQAALGLARSFASSFPDNVQLCLILTEMLLQACVYGEADLQAERLIRLAPEMQRAHALRGRIMMRSGRNADAVQCYETALRFGSLPEVDAELYDKARFNHEVQGGAGTDRPGQTVQLHNDSIPALNLGYSTRFEEAQRHVAKRGLKRPLRVLSFGCSVGNEVGLLKQAFPGAQIYGCDVDEASLRIAQSRQTDDRTVIFRSNPENLAKYGPFDVITCMSVLCRYPASEHIDDMSSHLPFSDFQFMLGIIDENLARNGVLILWNSVYPFSHTNLAARYAALPSRVVGLNGYSSLFHPKGRRLTRYMRQGMLCAQEILSPEDIKASDVTCVLWRKLADTTWSAFFARGCARMKQIITFGPRPDKSPGPSFNRIVDFSDSATNLSAKAESRFGLNGHRYVVGGFGIEIYAHKTNPSRFKGYWHYALESNVGRPISKRSALRRDMTVSDVAAFLS